MGKAGFKILDSDIHVMEPPDLWERYIDVEFKDRAPRVESLDPGPGRTHIWRFEGKVFPAFYDSPERCRSEKIRFEKAEARHITLGRYNSPKADLPGYEPSAMLQAMDTEGIDLAVVYRTMGSHFVAVDDLDPLLAAAVCRACNDWMYEFCTADSRRLRPSAIVPTQDINLSVKELRRAVERLGAVIVVISNHPVKGRPWYSRYYDPLWGAAQDLNVPIGVHGIQMAYQDHLGRRYMDNFALGHAAAHPIEMVLALGSMLTGGVFERFPKLKAAFLESNCGWLPWWLWALDERFDKFGDCEAFNLQMPPSEYFNRQCFVSVEPDEYLAEYVIREVGDRNIVISSDWPHDDSSYPRAMETFINLEGISAESKQNILWNNCARLYGISEASVSCDSDRG